MNDYTVLVIEGDDTVKQQISHALTAEKYRLFQAESGLGGLSLYYQERPDMVLMELSLPDMDGLEVLKLIRERSDTLVIIVSARDREEDKVQALDCGAVDYVTKPFHVEELMARIRAAFRRGQDIEAGREAIFTMDYLAVDFEKRKVYVHGKPVHLTPLEYQILCLLVDNKGKVLTNSYIQRQLWGSDGQGDYRRLRVFMSNVRKKIGDDAEVPRFIRTETGVGYRFADE